MLKGRKDLLRDFFFYVARSQVMLLIRAVRSVLNPYKAYGVLVSCWMNARVFSPSKCRPPQETRVVKGNEESMGELWYGKYYPRSVEARFVRERLSLVLTDIIKSTTLWNLAPDNMFRAIEAHDLIARRLCDKHGGLEIRNEGDSFFFVFEDSSSAIRFSIEFFEEVSEVRLATNSQDPTKEVALNIRIAVAEGAVVLSHHDAFCVQGGVVEKVYGILSHAQSSTICVLGSLRSVITPLIERYPFCLHNL
jgi:class 3 adenylate cyclase